MVIVLFALAVVATVSVLAWLFILLHPARAWDFQPVGDDGPIPDIDGSETFPEISILVPARNEALSLPNTLPALLTQNYPSPYHVILIDDRSADGTAGVAQKIAADLNQSAKLTVISGAPLPKGWSGKVWALDQGVKLALADTQAQFVLLTDADILHLPDSLRRLVAESVTAHLGLNSRMARLRCVSPAEKLLIPAFVFFFNLLYPMRRVNNPSDKTAAAAGGCVLLSREAVDKMGGGFAPIRNEIIDDVNLARQVKGAGLATRLSLSRSEVQSLRAYPRIHDIWLMVRRTAFTELKYSWVRLAGSMLGLGILFVFPVLAVCAGAAGILFSSNMETRLICAGALVKGGLALALIRAVYAPAVRFFDLPAKYAYTLPLSGVLYAMMTLDSALRHARGKGVQWRDKGS